MRSDQKALCLGLLAASAIVAPATVSRAQNGPAATGQDAGAIEEIVVTAQRRSENLQDVPVAVTAVSGEALAAKGVQSTADLASVTPGLNFTLAGGVAVPRIRGVGTGSPIGGNENPIATYVDGVYIANSSSALISLNNIAQVAVLKGPQGTLFGRNATGGLIQITTRDPHQDFGGEASLTYGNKDRIGADLYLTGGLAKGLAADVAVHYLDQGEGYGVNLFNGRDVNMSRDFAIRSKLKAELADTTSATLALDYAATRTVNPALRPISGSTPVTGAPFAGGDFDVNSNVQPLYASNQGGVSLTIDHDLETAKVVSITAYRQSKFKSRFDSDKLPLALAQTALWEPDKQFSQELQLLSKPGAMFDWMVGGYYFYARSELDPIRVTLPTGVSITQSIQTARSGAVFGQATVHLGPSTNLTGGLRFTTEKRKFRGAPSFQSNAGTVVPGAAVAGELSADKLTWRLALDHHFSDDTLGYVSYNRGFKSGGFNPSRAVNPLLPFAPEVLDAYEVGLKTDFLDKTVRLNAATFYYDYKNIQNAAFNNGVTTITNAASAKIYGLDLDATLAPTRNLGLNFGLSLIHDRFGAYPGATISTPLVPNGTTILGGNALTVGNAKGNRIANTPDWTANAGVDYRVPLAKGGLRFNLNYFHSDGWFAEADNRLRQSPYNLVNASATWFPDDAETYSLKLWVNNLTREAYAVQMVSAAPSDAVTMAAGRAFGLTAGAKF